MPSCAPAYAVADALGGRPVESLTLAGDELELLDEASPIAPVHTAAGWKTSGFLGVIGRGR